MDDHRKNLSENVNFQEKKKDFHFGHENIRWRAKNSNIIDVVMQEIETK